MILHFFNGTYEAERWETEHMNQFCFKSQDLKLIFKTGNWNAPCV